MLENVVATSWRRRKLKSAQLWFSTVLQRCDNINTDIVTLSQRRCASWEYIKKGIASCNWANPPPPLPPSSLFQIINIFIPFSQDLLKYLLCNGHLGRLFLRVRFWSHFLWIYFSKWKDYSENFLWQTGEKGLFSYILWGFRW